MPEREVREEWRSDLVGAALVAQRFAVWGWRTWDDGSGTRRSEFDGYFPDSRKKFALS